MIEDPDPGSLVYGLTLVLIHLRSSKVRGEVTAIFEETNVADLYEKHADPSVVVEVNGSMMGRGAEGHYVPIGLIVARGNVRGKYIPTGQGRILHMNAERMWTEPVIGYEPQDEFAVAESALQLFPGLVEDGAMGIYHQRLDEQATRTAVGVTREGDIVVAGAFGSDLFGLSLYDFAAILQLPTSAGGAGVLDAVNVDGGPGSHIYVPSLKQHWGRSREYFVGDFIRIVRKEKAR